MVRFSSERAKCESHARGNVHPRRPALLLRGEPGRTFPARPEPGRALKRTQARAAELASTRDTVAQRRRRISSCDALRSRTIRPLRTEQTRTNRRALRGATANRRCGRESDPATPLSREVARTHPRAAIRGLTRKAAQKVTVPIYRRGAAQLARPIQGGRGSSQWSGSENPATPHEITAFLFRASRLHAPPSEAAIARVALSLRRTQGESETRRPPFSGRLRFSSHTTCGAAHARDRQERLRSAIFSIPTHNARGRVAIVTKLTGGVPS